MAAKTFSSSEVAEKYNELFFDGLMTPRGRWSKDNADSDAFVCRIPPDIAQAPNGILPKLACCIFRVVGQRPVDIWDDDRTETDYFGKDFPVYHLRLH
jgi:hypothetical protein